LTAACVLVAAPFKTMECVCPKGGDPRAGNVIPQTYDQAYQLFYSAH
jgi:hypothetical protein